MAPPPPSPQLLLLAAVAGLLSPTEVRRLAPEKASARNLREVCRKFFLKGMARGQGIKSPPVAGQAWGGRRLARAESSAPAFLRLLDPQVVAEPAEETGGRCPEGLWPLPPQVGSWSEGGGPVTLSGPSALSTVTL